MKVGDLVRLDTGYPRSAGKNAILVEKVGEGTRRSGGGAWKVFVSGRIHPYHILEADMELISESE